MSQYNFIKIEFLPVLSLFACRMKKAFFQLHVSIFLTGFTGILGLLIQLYEGLLVWCRLITSVTPLLVFKVREYSFIVLITNSTKYKALPNLC